MSSDSPSAFYSDSDMANNDATVTNCQATTAATSAINIAYEDALDDVHTRFVLNLPDEELASSDRIFFQLEQAYWFYDDFICDRSELDIPRFKSLRPFAQKMFQISPLLDYNNFDQMWEEFTHYKRTISTYGTILLNAAGDKMILCQMYFGNSWTFPAGKVNQNETGRDAGARETYEETGFDPHCFYGLTKQMKDEADAKGTRLPWKPSLDEDDGLVVVDGGKRRTLYVCRGVPEDFPFEPVARKEVSEVGWHSFDDLPKKSFAVFPFIQQLKRWVKQSNNKNGAKKNKTPAKKRSGSAKKPNSRNSSRGRDSRGKVREDDALIVAGLAQPGEEIGWTEDDMFKANETILGRKITYNGSPHHFAEKGFDGIDPHAFHVVGGGFMNSGGGIASLAPPPDKSRLQPLFRPEGACDDGDHIVLQPFFVEDSPWIEPVAAVPKIQPTVETFTQQKKPGKSKKSNNIPLENSGKALLSMLQKPMENNEKQSAFEASEGFSVFLTDAEVTARSQQVKIEETVLNERLYQLRLQREESQWLHGQTKREIEEWVQNRPQSSPTDTFGDFRLDTSAIIKAMEAAMVKS